MAAVVLSVVAMAISETIKRKKAELSLLNIAVCLVVITLYALFVAPRLAPVFGGYYMRQVVVNSESKIIKGRWMIITSDSNAAILCKEEKEEEFWRKFTYSMKNTVVRVPWSEIKSIQDVDYYSATPLE